MSGPTETVLAYLGGGKESLDSTPVTVNVLAYSLIVCIDETGEEVAKKSLGSR